MRRSLIVLIAVGKESFAQRNDYTVIEISQGIGKYTLPRICIYSPKSKLIHPRLSLNRTIIHKHVRLTWVDRLNALRLALLSLRSRQADASGTLAGGIR